MSFSQMLSDLLSNHTMIYYVALPLTVVLYVAARYLQEKSNLALLNPLLIPMIAIIVLIIMTDSNAEDYQRGASIITWLLDPAIVALAIPLYLKFRMIKAQALPILFCCTISIIVSFFISYISCHLLSVNEQMIATLGARSITTPLAMDVSSRTGGIASVTACIVVCVGITGALIGFPLMKLFHIRSAQAQGLAMGAAAHAVGTSAANQEGQTQGAYSSLSLIVCGILTSFLATPLFILFRYLDSLF